MPMPAVEPPPAELFRQLADNARDIVIITEAEPLESPGPRIVYVNPAFTALTGYTPEEVIGRDPRFLQRPGQTDSATTAEIGQLLRMSGDFHGAILNFAKDDTPYWLDMKIFPLHDAEGRVTHFAAIERDITSRTLAELELRREAMQDPLTGLLNRRGFDNVVGRAWDSSESPVGAVVMIDVDRFKAVNDLAGHPVGDRVLTNLGRVLLGVSGDRGFAARIGGDEFALVLPEATQAEVLLAVEKLQREIRTARWTDEVGQLVTISIGIATRHSYADLATMVTESDKALYRAKALGGDRAVLASEA
ncbi:MAG: diguanylate cyclase [Actinobacteria bacterium]|nr:diguanylate cyclase [Actinomycetota bacterium]